MLHMYIQINEIFGAFKSPKIEVNVSISYTKATTNSLSKKLMIGQVNEFINREC